MKLRELLSQLQEAQKVSNSSQPFICGGVVRDRVLNSSIKDNFNDLDITTGDKSITQLSEQFFSDLLKKYNVTRKTMEDGHSSINIGTFKIDLSSNFNAPNIDSILKQKGINNPTDLQKEVYSRDFTCNALLLSLDLKTISDPTNQGIKDIKEKKIKTCLSPEITLTTNRNRVVRAIYLSSKLDFDIDESIIEFVKKHPESIKISTEKSMSDKLNEAFRRDPDRASDNLTKMNLWSYIPVISEVVYPYYMKHAKGQLNEK